MKGDKMEQKHLERLVLQSPVHVHTVTRLMDSRYQASHGYFDRNDACIVIMELWPTTVGQKFYVFSHEIQHAKCFMEDCECQCERLYYREFHAFRGQLKLCMRHPEPLAVLMEHLLDSDRWLRNHPAHRDGVDILKQTELWARALAKIERN